MKIILLLAFLAASPAAFAEEPLRQPLTQITEPPITGAEVRHIQAALMEQFKPCWHIYPVNGEYQPVPVNIDVEPDGSIHFEGFGQPPAEPASSYPRVANLAAQAVVDPKCSQLKQIPYPEKFNQWHRITVVFDPSLPIHW